MESYPPFQQPITSMAKQVDNPAWRLFFTRIGTFLSGAVTHLTGALTNSHIILGNGGGDIRALGSLGSSTTVLHGNAGGDPSFSAVALTTDVTGVLPIANGGTNSGVALSGSSIMISNGTAIVQGAAGTTTTLLHGNAVGAPTYAAVNLATEVTGDLLYANLTPATAASLLLGRGSAAGAGDWQEIALGSGLSMSGTTLSATAGTNIDLTPSFLLMGA